MGQVPRAPTSWSVSLHPFLVIAIGSFLYVSVLIYIRLLSLIVVHRSRHPNGTRSIFILIDSVIIVSNKIIIVVVYCLIIFKSVNNWFRVASSALVVVALFAYLIKKKVYDYYSYFFCIHYFGSVRVLLIPFMTSDE